MRSPSTDQSRKKSNELTSTSVCLVRTLQSEVGNGWEQLVEIYGPKVYRRCRHAGLRVEDAEDVTQEVFSAVARSILTFRRNAGTGSFRKWLSVITTNKLRDYWRRHLGLMHGLGGTSWYRRMQMVVDEVSDSSLSINEGKGEDSRLERIYQVRAECSERDWAIFERLVLDERSVEEVTREFSVTANVVYLIRSRLLRRLRRSEKVKAG